jgi:vacuolar protein sorting-associated protein 33A
LGVFAQTNIKFQLYFVPRRSFVCETILKEEGVYGDLKIGGRCAADGVGMVDTSITVAVAFVLGDAELEVDLIPLDDDLLSMEMPNVLRVRLVVLRSAASNPRQLCFFTCPQECYIEEDMTSLTQVAKSIMKLQRMFGVIPNVKSKGVLSKV